MLKKLGKWSVLGLFVTGMSGAFAAGNYPERPLRMYVGFAPGGATDLLARYIAKALGEELKQSVVVENKPGAGGNTAVRMLTQAEPDGYTFAIAANYVVTNAALGKNPYDWQKDLTPIALVAATPNVLVVPADSPVNSLAELIARAQQGPLTFASAGIGTSQHLSGELFQYQSKVKLDHIPYQGGTPAETDLIAGRVDMLFGNVATNVNWTQAGKVKPIAITGPNRIGALKGIPTIMESGLPDYDVQALYFTVAPGGVPEPVAGKLSTALQKVMKDPQTANYLATLYATPMHGGAAETTELLEREYRKWSEVSKATGLRIDQ